MFEPLFETVSQVLAGFYSLTNSYGGAIILLTIAVMIVTAPLTLKSTRSMVAMQRVQPELKKLQDKYKDDRERLNQEMMVFYKENDINPLSGCLPILLQAPIFLLLYRVLRGIAERQSGPAGGLGHLAGQVKAGLTQTPWNYMDQPFQPDHLSESTQLYKTLITESKMNFFGIDLALSPSQAIKMGLVTAIPFILLMIGMLVAQVIQNRQIQGRTNSKAPVNTQQQMMMKVLPFMLPIFSFTFPASLGLYYFVQGLCRIGLQSHITRTVYGADEPSVIETSGSEKELESDTAVKKAVKPPSSKSANGKQGSAKPASGKQAPKKQSVKSLAAQQKSSQKGTASSGRKSGSPRAGAPRKSGESSNKRG